MGMKKGLNAVFAAGLLAALLLCLAKAVFAPAEINEYENRYMEQFLPLSFDSYKSGEFQDAAELALGDQLPFAVNAKEQYNLRVSEITGSIFDRIVAHHKAAVAAGKEEPTAEELAAMKAAEEARIAAEKAAAEKEAYEKLQKELSLGIYKGERNVVQTGSGEVYYRLPSGRLIFGNHLLFEKRFLSGEQKNLDRYISSANAVIARHDDIEFYMYYIEKETDVDFQTGERSGIFEYLYDNINIPEENKRCFMVDSFEDFDKWFYKTDHHWAAEGSYRGYVQVLDMLCPGDTPLEIKGSTVIGTMTGSKATGSEAERYKDTVSVYEMDYPGVTVLQNGAKGHEYGRQLAYVKHVKEGGSLYTKAIYRSVYGPDNGETVIINENSDGGSILILGESYDNALMLPLSNHFNTIYNVDLRNYKTQTGKTFDFDSYVREHGITRVLLIGSLEYYVQSQFVIK